MPKYPTFTTDGLTYIGHGAESEVWSYPDNSRAVTYLSYSRHKIKFLRDLGLLWETPQKVWYSAAFNRKQVYIRAIVTKLKPVDWRTYRYQIEGKEEMFRSAWFAGYNGKNAFDNALTHVYENKGYFPLYKSLISFAWRYRKTWEFSLDMGDRNYMQCPVTGIIYPYDVFLFKRKGQDMKWRNFTETSEV